MQIAIGVGGGVVWFLLRGVDWAVAALAGMLISIFLTLFFAVRFFLRSRSVPPQQVTGVLYRTQALKFLLAVVLLSGATYHFGASAAALVTTFAATLAAYWFALLWLHR
jgi:F0F1-type ATP synthase assembly protein I